MTNSLIFSVGKGVSDSIVYRYDDGIDADDYGQVARFIIAKHKYGNLSEYMQEMPIAKIKYLENRGYIRFVYIRMLDKFVGYVVSDFAEEYDCNTAIKDHIIDSANKIIENSGALDIRDIAHLTRGHAYGTTYSYEISINNVQHMDCLFIGVVSPMSLDGTEHVIVKKNNLGDIKEKLEFAEYEWNDSSEYGELEDALREKFTYDKIGNLVGYANSYDIRYRISYRKNNYWIEIADLKTNKIICSGYSISKHVTVTNPDGDTAIYPWLIIAKSKSPDYGYVPYSRIYNILADNAGVFKYMPR